ncbi:SDR family oxidoreductase [Georgenia subflava]|uniref:NAD(P)H-binding protein n=1 Tax=Georgenia subflava TaxID=1622177 RepID=A0A6N7EI71_9MICO|nr:NAD(P)-binding oxidoreductase [Georgenia subflava]MPV36427.1 NAD(P)H-binding protein [Georgenia subflava]
MTTTVLLTGGTGTLGRLVAPLLRDAGLQVRVLSRNDHEPSDGLRFVTGDLSTGEGLETAMTGVDTIVHLAGSAKGDDDKTRNLVRAATRAGARGRARIGHLLYISVVGADSVPVVSRLDRAMFGYYAAKGAAERIVAESGIPWTTLRATQFHDLTLLTVQAMAKLPVVPVPSGFTFQPVDTGEVAARLVELALGKPAGLVPALGGPRVYGMDELVRSYLAATGRRRLLMPMHTPGGAARAMRDGANLAPTRAVGRRTWEEFLTDRLAPADVAPADVGTLTDAGGADGRHPSSATAA